MVSFKIGCSFDERLIDGVCLLNKGASIGRVYGFYGATRNHAWLSARPEYRLPDVSDQQLSAFVAKCRNAGITFNYSLNTIYAGSKRILWSRRSMIGDIVKYLYDIGVTRVTVASPLIAETVRRASPSMELEVSTIAHIDTITQIKAWKERYDIKSVCGNLLKNRCISFLRLAADYCRRVGVTYEVMVNEFCCIGPEGDGTSTTYCIYRDSCYLCHAEDLTAEDSGLFEAYPMSRCVQSRHAPEIWLKANFIRPEDVPRYAELGIGDFKITGRTGGTEFLLSLADAYVRGRLEGNLLSLWKHLETIGSGMSELEWAPSCYIDNAKLEHFVDWWFDDPERDCANEVCGETCTYCDGFLG